MVRDWALPKSFAGSKILLPANLGNSLQQQPRTMQGSCQHFVLQLQRSVSKKTGLAKQQDSHSLVQHRLSSTFSLVSQTNSCPNASQYTLFHPDKPSKNQSAVRNGTKKNKKKCRAGDQGNRRQTWEPFLCFAFPYKMTASRTVFSASSAEHSST